MTEIAIVDKYQQQYAHFGRMNDILYKLPPLFSTIIGALWFFAVSYMSEERFISMGVFIFAFACCLCFWLVMHRFRLAFNAYIDNINKMDGEMMVTLKKDPLPSTITALIWLLNGGAAMSAVAAIYTVCR